MPPAAGAGERLPRIWPRATPSWRRSSRGWRPNYAQHSHVECCRDIELWRKRRPRCGAAGAQEINCAGTYGIAPPVEVTYDDFTEDIEPNRLLRAAIASLLRLRVRRQQSRSGLRAIENKLSGVQLVQYDSRRLPHVAFNRLNMRYRPAVDLARLILRSTSFELSHGEVAASAFLIDMNKVFEDFVVIALREALGVTERESFKADMASRCASTWLGAFRSCLTCPSGVDRHAHSSVT